MKLEEVLRQHLEKRVAKMGRIELARALGMSAANLDYIRSGYRMRKGGKRQLVDFPPSVLDALAVIEDISIAEKMRQIAIETATMEVASGPEASEEAREPTTGATPLPVKR